MELLNTIALDYKVVQVIVTHLHRVCRVKVYLKINTNLCNMRLTNAVHGEL